MKKIILILIALLVLVGGYLYFKDNSIKKQNTINKENKLTIEETNEGETKSVTQAEVKSSSDDKNTTPADILNYELEDGEHFAFVTDYGIENGEPFIIFDKIQADFSNSQNFPLFSNSNTLKRKLFLSRGSSLLPVYDKVEEDYWNKKRIPDIGGLEDIHTIKDINKNEILVITVSKNKIWSVRHTSLNMELAKIDFDLKLKDGTYSGSYKNFIKSDGVYYLTLSIEKEGTVSLKVDERIQIKMIGAGIGAEEIIPIEEFKNIAYDFERVWYYVSVGVKNNIIEEITFYMPRP